MRKWNFKVVLAGDGAVGKTSIREKYMGRGFEASYLKTIGADFASKKIQTDEDSIAFQIWDLAGQESYQAVRSTFYKGAAAAILVFDCQDPKTMTNLSSWLEEASKGSNNGILIYFVIANKVDLEEKRRVSIDMALEFCNRLEAETGIHFYYSETSALSGHNIQETFDFLAYKLLEANNIQSIVPPANTGGIIDIREHKQEIVIKETRVESVASTSDVTREDIEAVNHRIDTIEERLNTIQTIIKKIVQKMQEE
ncbi:MAG: GTP-binding protein [Candidatus Heimdallarchaeota archaeon]|nr:GTP-binding protein [Candidatus Heimdallarchaeota archaeon]